MFYCHRRYLDDCVLFIVSYHTLEHHHCAIEAAGLADFSKYAKGVLCLDQGKWELQVQREEMMVGDHHFPEGMVDYCQNCFHQTDLWDCLDVYSQWVACHLIL